MHAHAEPLAGYSAERHAVPSSRAVPSPDLSIHADAPATPAIIGATSPTFLAGLQTLAAQVPALRIEASSESLDALLERANTMGECVVLMDADLGQRDLQELLQTLHDAAPRARTVLIADNPSAYQVRQAVRGGAVGFVEKTASTHEITSALAAAARGIRYLTPTLSCRLAESVLLPELTRRERDVLREMSRGACNKLIARELGITVGTVKTHVCSLLDKFDARSRTDAVLKAGRFGIVCLQ